MAHYDVHSSSPLYIFFSFWKHRELIYRLSVREVMNRYRGSYIGILWSLITPLLMISIYTFVFSEVFNARWGVNDTENKYDFAIILFSGMIVFGLFSDMINRSPKLIISNVSYVKKVVFPLEILSWVNLGSSLFHTFISLVVLLFMQLLYYRSLPWTIVFFPLILIPLILLSMGCTWFLSSLGVYVRDIEQAVGFLVTILMFSSAVFYPVDNLPEKYQFWFRLNPLVLIIEESRNILIFGIMPDWGLISFLGLASAIVASFGFWWFQKTRKGFSDVL